MDALESAVRLARECHTKQSWENFFSRHGETISSAAQSRPLQDIFKLLKEDPQSLQYNPTIWGQLISGCLSCWNLELGREIAEFVRKISSATVAIPSTQLYLESGQPGVAREIANRAIRLTTILPKEKVQLEMQVCTSYAEEGKKSRAIRLLNQLEPSVRDANIEPKVRADFLTQMGRMHYLLGRYIPAGDLFLDAYPIYLSLKDWEAAAKAVFNTGGCYHNGGGKKQDQAFALIEECRRLAGAHNLAGPLAHCESFYGLIDYQRGNFAGAREHWRRALEHLPVSDKSYRRLHILSMLALTYLAQGRYHHARKFGGMTLNLAALDESERLKSRFESLEAELLWEDGNIPESLEKIRATVRRLELHGVHNLEELTTLSRFNIEAALVDESEIPNKVIIDEELKKHAHTWTDYIYSTGLLLLNRDDFAAATDRFQECIARAREHDSLHQEALGLLGLIQTHLKQRQPDKIDGLLRDFEVAIAKIGETPLRGVGDIIHAARAYQRGDFDESVRLLKVAGKNPRLSYVEKFCVECSLATIEGKSPRLVATWQHRLLARFTRTFFAPTFEAIDERNFRVSTHYVVSLERHPAIAELLQYLLSRTNFSATPSEIQTQVWKQSVNAQGWHQKIRNTIMRLRDFLPYSIAPLVLHSDNSISLFGSAVKIRGIRAAGVRAENEVLRLLHDAPMSSVQLSTRLQISAATTKRILKKLAEKDEIRSIKEGRNIVYCAGHDNAAPPN